MTRSPSWLAVILVLLSSLLPAAPKAATPASAQAQPSEKAIALPRGCIGVTPPGQEEATCCVNGAVYLDGQPIAGAEVQINTTRGGQVTLVTQVYAGEAPEPYFRQSLSAAPLAARVGETITIRARYGLHEHTVVHTVQPGSQSVDIVLSATQEADYRFQEVLERQADAGSFHEPVAVALDAERNIYVLDQLDARVQVFSPLGARLAAWGSSGNLPGQFDHPSDIAVDANGKVYIVDTRNHRVQKFSNRGAWITMWGGFGSAAGQLDSPTGIGIGADGGVIVADTDNRRVQRFTADGLYVAGWQIAPSNGAQYLPADVAADSGGNVIVALNRVLGDTGNQYRISKYSIGGEHVRTWLDPNIVPGESTTSWGFSHIAVGADDQVYVLNGDLSRFSAQMVLQDTWLYDGSTGADSFWAKGVAIDPSGNRYVAEGIRGVVRLYAADRTDRGTIGLADRKNHFSGPQDVAVDRQGNVYVADTYNCRIQKFNAQREWVATWGSCYDFATYFRPTSITIDANQVVYIIDRTQLRPRSVVTLSTEGVILSRWSLEDPAAPLADPWDIAVDQGGHVFIADGSRSQILEYTNSGQFVAAHGSPGTANGQFSSPTGLALDSSGNFYVADSVRTQVFSGDWTWRRSIPHRNTATSRNRVKVAVDRSGGIYVLEADSRISKRSPDGRLLMSRGSIGSGIDEYQYPDGIYVDDANLIYVADTLNTRVQIWRPMTQTHPVATISWASTRSLTQGQGALTLRGSARDSDADGNPSAFQYRWYAQNTLIGTGAALTVPTTSLPVGAYEVQLEVIDDEGEVSPRVGVPIDVATPPLAAWTFMLYLVADSDLDGNELLDAMDDRFGTGLLARLRRQQQTAPNASVQVVVQLDPPGDGNTRRLILRPDGEFDEVMRRELPMDSEEVLAEFVRWVRETRPANAYYLAIASHGNGYQGVAWDDTSGDGAYLSVDELRRGLENASGDGARPIDVIHLDACSMGLLDVAYELRGQATYLVVSQNVGWSFFLEDRYRAQTGASTQPRELGQLIVNTYAQYAEDESSSSGGRELYPYTISLLDLRRVEPAVQELDRLARELGGFAGLGSANRATLATIRDASQKFDSPEFFELNVFDEYVDLTNWASRLIDSPQIGDLAIRSRAQSVLQAVKGESNPLVVAQRNSGARLGLSGRYGSQPVDLSGAGGISVYYPHELSRSVTTQIWYRYKSNLLFQLTRDSQWDEFLRLGNLALPSPPVSGPEPGRPRLALPGVAEQSMYLPYVGR